MTVSPTKRNIYVIDASIAVKWFSHEQGSNVARTILKEGVDGKIELLTSDLLMYEVGNALARGKKLGASEILTALIMLQNSCLRFVALDVSMMEHSATFADKYGITFYDAVYAALALRENAILLTANPKDQGKISEIKIKKI
ncbi:MAG: type II toxin-antitoxin system VapC family toxin [Patescibacteria group bacterium]